MKKWILIATTFGLVLSFQNCAQQRHGEMGSAAELDQSQNFNKTSIEGFKKIALWDYQRNQFLDLDLSSGKMVAFEEYGEVRGDTFCLSEQDADGLRQILAGAEICEPLMDPEMAGRLCTQEYTYPYATLVDSAYEVKLGEKVSGCDKPTDLCDAKASALKKWVMGIVANLDSKTCQ